jgi:predicted transcriptional regulator
MTINEIAVCLGLICVQHVYPDVGILTVYTSDLLSDVLAHADDKALLVTVQAHKNTIAVASVKESPAVIVCNGRAAPDDMIAAAEEEQIGIFMTDLDQFTVSGRLYELLHADLSHGCKS